jgi:hypothetical protein
MSLLRFAIEYERARSVESGTEFGTRVPCCPVAGNAAAQIASAASVVLSLCIEAPATMLVAGTPTLDGGCAVVEDERDALSGVHLPALGEVGAQRREG